jgi:DNA-directed RNA polymerase subunit E'/Rpb7
MEQQHLSNVLCILQKMDIGRSRVLLTNNLSFYYDVYRLIVYHFIMLIFYHFIMMYTE